MQPAISNSISLFISALPNELNEEKWNAAAIGCPREQSSNCFSFVKKRNAAVPAALPEFEK